MRTLTIVVGFAAVLMLTGCPPTGKNFLTGDGRIKAPIPAAPPTAEVLVQNLNDNAQRLQSIQADSLRIRAEADGQGITLLGRMTTQKPSNFRLQADIMGKRAVDMGSNSQEFWYWVSQANPPALVYCSYEDFRAGRARMPFPFQPEWIIETLGMMERNPKGVYQVEVKPNTIELVEQTTSPQGQPVRKVTFFARTPLQDGRYPVVGHQLQDAKGQPICTARVEDTHYDRTSGAAVPRQVTLSWPAEHLQLSLKLDGLTVNNTINPTSAGMLFTRPNMPRSIDLAKVYAQPMGLQQAGAYSTPTRR
jgi:hypothetical protein